MSLEERRKRGDLIQMIKAIYRLEKIKWHMAPSFAQDSQICASESYNRMLLRELISSCQSENFLPFQETFLNRIIRPT